MKLKKLTSLLLATVMFVTAISVFTSSALADSDTASKLLGAASACSGNIYGEFSGVPACVNENGELHFCKNNFPDSAFRVCLYNEFGIEENSYISEKEADAVSDIYCPTYESYNNNLTTVTSLKGIEFFRFLTTLYCNGFDYASLSSGGKLKDLNIDNNKMLKKLDCCGNQISQLNITNNTKLTDLNCDYNRITSLDVSNNPELTSFSCAENQITELDVSNNPNLATFFCQNNQLKEIDLRSNVKLITLNCSNNKLTKLDVSNNPQLESLSFNFNEIYNLDLSHNRKITYTSWFGNHLAQLDLIGLKQYSFEYHGENLEQTIELKAYQNVKGSWNIDLSQYITKDGLKNVTVTTENAEYDSKSGVITLNYLPERITYSYYNGLVGDWDNLDSMNPQNPFTHIFVIANVTKGDNFATDQNKPIDKPDEPATDQNVAADQNVAVGKPDVSTNDNENEQSVTVQPSEKPEAENITENGGDDSAIASESQNSGTNGSTVLENIDNPYTDQTTVSPNTGVAGGLAVLSAVITAIFCVSAAIIILKRKMVYKTK